MTPQPSILERNLQALFTRAYVPVRASAAFRAQLLRRLNREIARPAATRHVHVWRAAAAVLLLVGAAVATWFAVRGDVDPQSRESLLASGRTALRDSTVSDWRALTDGESSRGVEFETGRLELATSKSSDARVWTSAAGRVDAAPSTMLSIQTGPERDVHTLQLDSGSIALERYAPDGRFEIATPHGRLVLERGALRVACVSASDLPAGWEPGSAVRARLESGEAWLDTQPGHTQLGLGSDVYLRNARIVRGAQPELDGSVLPTDERSTLPSVASTSAAPSVAPALIGRLRTSQAAALPERFVVTLLREVRLPDVSEPEPHTFADARGEFVLPALEPGTYRIFVEAHGFAVWQVAYLSIVAGAPTIELDVLLERGVTLRGRVIDADTRAPIEGACVLSETDTPSQIVPFACDEDSMQGWLAVVRSGPDGRFELPGLSRATHVLRATRAGFGAGWSQRVDLTGGAEPDELELALAPGGTIFGRVARDDGGPQPGALVIASYLPSDDLRTRMSYSGAQADAEGRFSIVDLVPGSYVVLYVPEPGTAQSVDPLVQQVRVERGRSTEINLPGREHGTRLIGRVLTADGTPLADADVSVQTRDTQGSDGWRAERTHAQGDFAFSGLEPATYQVFVGRGLGQYFVWQADVDVPDAPQFELELRLDGGVLAGHVRDAITRRGLVRSVLILEIEREREWQFAGRGFSTADGSFEFTHLRAGNYRVHAYATAGRFAPQQSPDVWVGASGGQRDLELALAPGAALTIRVRDSSGKPVARAQIQLVDSDGHAIQHTQEDITDAHGELIVPGIRPGRWTVRVEHRAATTIAAVELTAGAERVLELALAPPK